MVELTRLSATLLDNFGVCETSVHAELRGGRLLVRLSKGQFLFDGDEVEELVITKGGIVARSTRGRVVELASPAAPAQRHDLTPLQRSVAELFMKT